mgnify:CR=1 FL=1
MIDKKTEKRIVNIEVLADEFLVKSQALVDLVDELSERISKLEKDQNKGWLSDPVCYNMYLIDRVERVNYADNI